MSTRKPLAARTPTTYDNRVHGRPDSRIPPGNYILNEGSTKLNLVRPEYEKPPLIVRPFPALDYAEPGAKFQLGRQAPEEGAYTDWFVRVPTADYVGLTKEDKKTFVLYSPTDKEDRAGNPYVIFYYACTAAFDAGKFGCGQSWLGEWNRLIDIAKAGNRDSKGIKKPSAKYLMQGAVYANGEKTYVNAKRARPLGLADGDELPVICVSEQAGRGMIGLLDQRKEEYDASNEALDPSVGFVWGDPVGKFLPGKRLITNGGVFLTVFHPKYTKITGEHSSWDGTIPESGFQGYEVALAKALDINGQTLTPRIDELGVGTLFEKLQFWWDDPVSGEKGLVRIAPVEQQALWVAQAFRAIPQLLLFAWAEHDEFMTAEVKGVLAARASAVVPGATSSTGVALAATRQPSTRKDPTAPTPPPPEEDEVDAPTGEEAGEAEAEAAAEAAAAEDAAEEDAVERQEEEVDEFGQPLGAAAAAGEAEEEEGAESGEEQEDAATVAATAAEEEEEIDEFELPTAPPATARPVTTKKVPPVAAAAGARTARTPPAAATAKAATVPLKVPPPKTVAPKTAAKPAAKPAGTKPVATPPASKGGTAKRK